MTRCPAASHESRQPRTLAPAALAVAPRPRARRLRAGRRPGRNPNLGWIEASSPKSLEVDRAEYRHAVYFATDRARISGARAGPAAGVPGRASQPSAQRHHPPRGPCRRARHRPLQCRARRAPRRRASSALPARAGLRRSDRDRSAFGEAVPAAAGSGPAAWQQNRRVELVLERYLVTLPPCPDWSRAERHRLRQPAAQQLRLRHPDQSRPDGRRAPATWCAAARWRRPTASTRPRASCATAPARWSNSQEEKVEKLMATAIATHRAAERRAARAVPRRSSPTPRPMPWSTRWSAR